MKPIKLALVGCGGIAGAHVDALAELWGNSIRPFRIVAVCDVVKERAAERAAQIAQFQKNNKKPAVFTDLDKLLAADVEAVDICTLHSEHHTLATRCLGAGKHVHIEKPLAITMRAGRQIMDAAVDAQRVLAVGENYRRSPAERATNQALRQGRIGRPRTFYWHDVGEAMGKWGWRNFKRAAGAGWTLDGGVHFADLFLYQLGTRAHQVTALTRLYEPYRYDDPARRQGAWQVDVEDAAMALIQFDDEVVVQWTWQGSAPGQGFNKRVLYGSEGCMDWESGLWLRDGTHVERETLVEEYMQGLAAAEKERLFPGGVTNPIAQELNDFAAAVRLGTVPEVDGEMGFRALALCLALFESSWFGRPVSLQEIERCETEGYQAEINQALGIV